MDTPTPGHYNPEIFLSPGRQLLGEFLGVDLVPVLGDVSVPVLGDASVPVHDKVSWRLVLRGQAVGSLEALL